MFRECPFPTAIGNHIHPVSVSTPNKRPTANADGLLCISKLELGCWKPTRQYVVTAVACSPTLLITTTASDQAKLRVSRYCLSSSEQRCKESLPRLDAFLKFCITARHSVVRRCSLAATVDLDDAGFMQVHRRSASSRPPSRVCVFCRQSSCRQPFVQMNWPQLHRQSTCTCACALPHAARHFQARNTACRPVSPAVCTYTHSLDRPTIGRISDYCIR